MHSLRRSAQKKLQNKISDQWYSVISGSDGPLHNQSSKLRFYKLFKTSFHGEPYLDFVSDFKLRRKITKFRCSDHALEIEVGRHRKLNVEDRLCKLCNVDVESELHFLQICPLYNKIRTQCFGNNLLHHWIDKLQYKDIKSAFNLANYLSKAFDWREKLLAFPN